MQVGPETWVEELTCRLGLVIGMHMGSGVCDPESVLWDFVVHTAITGRIGALSYLEEQFAVGWQPYVVEWEIPLRLLHLKATVSPCLEE